MNWIKYIAAIFFFTSCMTAKKAESYLNDHNTEAAKYCSEKFPVIEKKDTTYVSVDSGHYKEAFENISHSADSIFFKLDSLQHAATPEHPYVPVNLDSLHKLVYADIKRGLKPCKDSIIHEVKTVVDNARVVYLMGLLDQKDQTITKQEGTIADKDKKIERQAKWVWYFWILVALLGLYSFLKIKKVF